MTLKPWRMVFPHPGGHGATIEVDGRDITKELHILKVEVHAAPQEPVEVVLHCWPDSLEMSGWADITTVGDNNAQEDKQPQ